MARKPTHIAKLGAMPKEKDQNPFTERVGVGWEGANGKLISVRFTNTTMIARGDVLQIWVNDRDGDGGGGSRKQRNNPPPQNEPPNPFGEDSDDDDWG